MGLFLSGLIGALAASMGTLAGRVMIALGFGVATYSGITAGVESLKQTAISQLSGLPADTVSMLGFLWVDKGLTVIFSAFATALTMRTVGGSIKKMVLK